MHPLLQPLNSGLYFQVLHDRVNDSAEIELVNTLQDEFRIESKHADPLSALKWDIASLDELKAEYLKENAMFDRDFIVALEYIC
jgi:hypothetical protein